jgi:RNA polymerase sigma-70 factor, ECF subfamily
VRGRDPAGRRTRRARGRQLTGYRGRADIEALWRIEFPKLVAAATRITRDTDLAEQIAQDAFVSALEQWDAHGVPDRPGAWLMAVAKRRAIDLMRRETSRDNKYQEIAREAAVEHDEVTLEDRADGHIDDDLLRLLFICCHPVLGREARVALTLRLLGGLSTHEIARAQLLPSATAGQRIARAKRTIAEARIAFENPSRDQQVERLPSVLEVVYLIFNEGYAATSGEDWTRPDLAGEALRLGRMLTHLMPRVAEVHGLLALMEIQASRFNARRGADGPVLLEHQNRMLWDRLLIRRGLEALDRAAALGGGPYTAQAAIAACHARAVTYEGTDWAELARLYDAYVLRYPSPVAELNRGIAHFKAHGTAAARKILRPLLDDARMARYHLLHATLAELALADGNSAEAKAHLRTAMSLTANAADLTLLGAKHAALLKDATDNPTESDRRQ